MTFLFTTTCVTPPSQGALKSPSLSPYRSMQLQESLFEDDMLRHVSAFSVSPDHSNSASDYYFLINPITPTRPTQESTLLVPSTPENSANNTSASLSPLTPLSAILPSRYKRLRDQDSPSCCDKSNKIACQLIRSFPTSVEIRVEEYPLFYKQFFASQYSQAIQDEKYASSLSLSTISSTSITTSLVAPQTQEDLSTNHAMVNWTSIALALSKVSARPRLDCVQSA
jgi:hypothetical protein